jgi:hypothetical protein
MNGERVNNVDGDEATHANTYFHQEKKKKHVPESYVRLREAGREPATVSGDPGSREGCRA